MSRFKSLVFWLMVLLPSVSWAQAEEVREIKIVAAVSSMFKKENRDWNKEIWNRVTFANEVFEKQFGIHFAVKNFLAWEPQDETREMGLLLEELRALSPIADNEIVVGFHRMSKPFTQNVIEDIDTVGSAQFFRGYAVIRDPFAELKDVHRNIILAHELAHLFGAVHVSDEGQIMNPTVPAEPVLVLDDDNREILQSTRAVDFRKGAESLEDLALDGMIRIYEKLIRRNPHSDFYYQLGMFYQMRNQPAKAISTWEEAIRYQYDNPHIHRALGFHYYRAGRYDKAVQELASAIAHFILPSQKKDRALVLNFLGVAYYENGNVEQAIFNWMKGLTDDPDHIDLQSNLAAAYLQSGSVDRAETEFEKLAAKYPEDTTILSNLGVARMKRKEFEKAAENFRDALEKHTQNHAAVSGKEAGRLMNEIPEWQLHLNLGAAYLELKRGEEAVSELQAAEKLEPANFDIHRNLAQAYLDLRSYDNAVKEIQEALRYRKDDPYLYAMLGQAYFETGRRDEAIQAAQDGLKYASGDLSAALHKNLGSLYLEQKKLPDAANELRASVNQNWKDPDAHTRLGVVYAQSGQTDDAKRSFETALHLDPKYEEAKRLLDSLAGKNQ